MHIERRGSVVRARAKFGGFVDEHGEGLNIIGCEFAPQDSGALAQGECHIGTDDGGLMLAEFLRVENRRGFLDNVADAFQKFGGRIDAFDDFRVAGCTIRTFGGKGDAQCAGSSGYFIEEGSRGMRCGIGIAVGGTVRCVEHGGAVAHGARDDMGNRHAAPAFTAIRPHRCARARGLHAEESTGGSGNADRSTAVACIGKRKDASGNGGGRAT